MIFHACCFVTIIEKLSENDLGQQIPDRCIRRNFEIDGHDMIDPHVTSNMSLRECQTLCKLTIGCHFFTYKIGFINQCLLKLASAEDAWKDPSPYPDPSSYSGSTECGKKRFSPSTSLYFTLFLIELKDLMALA